jgi:enterochelin esterase-like enzyme
MKPSIFKSYLQKQIKRNMKEWKKGRWSSQKQALAVSYSQAREYMKSRRSNKRKNKKTPKKRTPKKGQVAKKGKSKRRSMSRK